MVFLVFDSQGQLYYYSTNWPQARAVLDFLVQKDVGCPRLEIHKKADFTVV